VVSGQRTTEGGEDWPRAKTTKIITATITKGGLTKQRRRQRQRQRAATPVSWLKPKTIRCEGNTHEFRPTLAQMRVVRL